jgi:hypothetical protein
MYTAYARIRTLTGTKLVTESQEFLTAKSRAAAIRRAQRWLRAALSDEDMRAVVVADIGDNTVCVEWSERTPTA